RLALFVRVRALDFRISAGQCVALTMTCLALWLALGVAQRGVPGTFDFGGLATALAAIPVLLLVCFLAATLFGEARLALAFAVVLLAAVPAFLVVDYAAELLWDLVPQTFATVLDWVVLVWALAIAARGQALLTGWRGRRSALALLLLAALVTLL